MKSSCGYYRHEHTKAQKVPESCVQSPTTDLDLHYKYDPKNTRCELSGKDRKAKLVQIIKIVIAWFL